MILLTGATGNFGGSTAAWLSQKNIRFRSAARNLEALRKRFNEDIEVAAFDWDKPETYPTVLKGITTVSLMPPPVVTNDFHKTAELFIEAARKAGAQHIVFTSALYSDERDSMFYESEALVKRAGMNYTIIRPSFVFQNFLNQFLQSVRNGVILAPSEKGRTSYVDIRNVGEATAIVLANPQDHNGATYSITGSDALTHAEMAVIFSKQLLKPVVHVSPTVAEYKKKLAELNVPVFLHEFLGGLYQTIARGQWQRVSNDYELLSGKKPVTFTDFVSENRPVFLAERTAQINSK